LKIRHDSKTKEITLLYVPEDGYSNNDIPYDDRIESMILNAMRDNYMRCYKTFYCKCDAPLIRTNVNNGEYCGKCGFNFKQ